MLASGFPTLVVRPFIYCAVAVGCVVPSLRALAQSNPGPTLAPPPAASPLPAPVASALPVPVPTPASPPAATAAPTESPSEPWKPAPGAPVADGVAPNILPD